MKMTEINTDVNQFPSHTYGWLKIDKTNLNTVIEEECVASEVKLPSDVEVKRYSPTTDVSESKDESIIQTGLGKSFDSQFDSLKKDVDLNTNVYTVKENSVTNNKVYISYKPESQKKSASDIVIKACHDSKSIFILSFEPSTNNNSMAESLFGIRIKIILEQNAYVHLITVNLLDNSFTHFNSIGTSEGDNSKIEVTQIEVGANKVYNGLFNNLYGNKSSSIGHLGYIVKKSDSLDINYVAHQCGKSSDSKYYASGVVGDNAQKVWRGTIDFINGAKKATGNEQEEVLLLSPNVVNKTLPVILCDEEDVEGSHGASIGRLNSEILLYMESRGIDKETAEKLMVKSKIYSVCRFIPDEDLVENIKNYVEEVFAE